MTKIHCASCYMCIMACPYGVLKLTFRYKEIMKCDMCTHRGECGNQCALKNVQCMLSHLRRYKIMKYVVIGASAAGINGVKRLT